ncbi:MAG: VWA domain-containing protein [Comamonadaceae bacterium]|nr:MAG: VWA domain-containing protein [Comamonadaceae bacterium]
MARPAARKAALGGPIDWPQTLAARRGDVLQVRHVRRRAVQPANGALHCFLLDCSASMRTSGALAQAKGLLLNLMDEAYRHRDRVALLCFAGGSVEMRLSPRRAAVWNEDWLAPIGGGGGTPLALGVTAAGELLRRQKAGRRSLWLLTDGRTRENPPAPVSADELHVLDFESSRFPFARAAQLAADWGASYTRYDAIDVAE